MSAENEKKSMSVLLIIALLLGATGTLFGIWAFIKVDDMEDRVDVLEAWHSANDDRLAISRGSATFNTKDLAHLPATMSIKFNSAMAGTDYVCVLEAQGHRVTYKDKTTSGVTVTLSAVHFEHAIPNFVGESNGDDVFLLVVDGMPAFAGLDQSVTGDAFPVYIAATDAHGYNWNAPIEVLTDGGAAYGAFNATVTDDGTTPLFCGVTTAANDAVRFQYGTVVTTAHVVVTMAESGQGSVDFVSVVECNSRMHVFLWNNATADMIKLYWTADSTLSTASWTAVDDLIGDITTIHMQTAKIANLPVVASLVGNTISFEFLVSTTTYTHAATLNTGITTARTGSQFQVLEDSTGLVSVVFMRESDDRPIIAVANSTTFSGTSTWTYSVMPNLLEQTSASTTVDCYGAVDSDDIVHVIYTDANDTALLVGKIGDTTAQVHSLSHAGLLTTKDDGLRLAFHPSEARGYASYWNADTGRHMFQSFENNDLSTAVKVTASAIGAIA